MTTTLPPSNEKVQAFFLRGQEIRRVETSNCDARALPESLVVPPGDYFVMGQKYSLREEGLYRFLHPMVENRHCIVFQEDVWSLMSAVSWLVSHGYRDNGKTFEEKTEIARRGKLIITCSDVSEFSLDLFQKHGIPIRLVNIATLEDPNFYNDGHSVTEVKFEGRWILFDPDQGALYSDGRQRLSILELLQSHYSTGYQREKLSAGIPVAMGHFEADGYAYDLWFETHTITEELYGEMFNRPLGIPLISNDGVIYYTAFSEDDRHRAEQLYSEKGYQYLPEEEFHARFY